MLVVSESLDVSGVAWDPSVVEAGFEPPQVAKAVNISVSTHSVEMNFNALFISFPLLKLNYLNVVMRIFIINQACLGLFRH